MTFGTGSSATLTQKATGGAGGFGVTGGSGGNASTVLSETAARSGLTVNTTAVGGDAGSASGTTNGLAGNALADSTAETDGTPPAASYSLGPAANATASGGGAMSGTGGTATADATAADTSSVPPTNSLGANAVATATGGVSFDGAGGSATADATASGNPGGAEFAAAGATATGGSGTTGTGAANATANATGLQGNGASVAAESTANAVGSSGTATATAQNRGSGIDDVIAGASAAAQQESGGIGTANAQASVGTFNNFFFNPGQTGSGNAPGSALAYSYATAAPNTSSLRFFDSSIGPNVNQYLLQQGSVLAGATILGTNYDPTDLSGAVHTYTADATFSPPAATGDTILLGLSNYQEYGFDSAPATLQSIELSVTEGTTTVLDDRFTSLSAAETFFTDDAVNLGAADGAPVDVQLSVTGSGAGGFAADTLLGTGASAPPPASPVCFCAGTLIRTPYGNIPVEALKVGDFVVTASGAHRPIRWLGSRMTYCRRHPRPHECMPIYIAAHAFGKNRPARDLRVSPGHSLCMDVLGEVLIPAGALVNGSTIQQVEVDEVTYWHIELDRHDILIAENMAAESYLEMGNRGFFAENVLVALRASPDALARTHTEFCRPFHGEGPMVDAARAQLATRAKKLAWCYKMDQAKPADARRQAARRKVMVS